MRPAIETATRARDYLREWYERTNTVATMPTAIHAMHSTMRFRFAVVRPSGDVEFVTVGRRGGISVSCVLTPADIAHLRDVL